MAGVTAGVLINGQPGGNPSVQSPTQLMVTVLPGTTSGPITVHNSNGVGFSVGNFVVNAAPTASISRNVNTLTSSPADTYQWYRNTTLLTGDTARIYTATQSGTYSVVVTQNGCTSAPSAGIVVNITGLVDNLPNVTLTLYPNPITDGRLMVELTGTAQPLALTLFDALGRPVLTGDARPDAAGATRTDLDTHGLGRGVYLLRATAPDGRGLSRRVVVE